MRIGILTLPLHTNYGGILQAYALQTILKRMGHEVVVFDTQKHLHLPIWKWPLSIPKRFIMKYIFRKKTTILAEYKYNKTLNIINQHTQRFIKTYINRKIINDLSELKSTDYDAIVVGSDQVWRPKYFRSAYRTEIKDAFLDFTQDWDIRRISYATSFGTDDWEFSQEETTECRQAIALFEALSVREDSAVNLCSTHFGKKPQHILDPTFMLSEDDYTRLFEHSYPSTKNNGLFCYILDRNAEKKNLIEKVSAYYHMEPSILNADTYNRSISLEERIQPPVETWLQSLYNANFIITDSFHACVFSIIFEKPFIVIANQERGIARIHSLLKTFGLQDRIATIPNAPQLIEQKINWRSVKAILTQKKEESMLFLANHLKV